MLLISLIKFLHLLIALSIFGLMVFYLYKPSFITKPTLFVKIILLLSVLALITGTFLVPLKEFTFKMPWIQTAYFLSFFFILCTLSLLITKKKFLRFVILLFSLILLLSLIHDAVFKKNILSLFF